MDTADIEMTAALKMADGILRTIAQFFDESGCPLNEAQRAAMDEALEGIALQAAEVARWAA